MEDIFSHLQAMSSNTMAAVHPLLSQAKVDDLRGPGETITQPRSGLLGWDNLGRLVLPPRMLGASSLANGLNTCACPLGGDELLLESNSRLMQASVTKHSTARFTAGYLMTITSC